MYGAAYVKHMKCHFHEHLLFSNQVISERIDCGASTISQDVITFLIGEQGQGRWEKCNHSLPLENRGVPSMETKLMFGDDQKLK